MKVLISYFTLSGNTEIIAKKINEALIPKNNVSLKKIEDTQIEDIEKCSLLFIGFPCHANNIPAAIKDFFKNNLSDTQVDIVGFITHSSPMDSKKDYEGSIKGFKEICAKHKINIKAIFSCQGKPSPEIAQFIKREKGIDPDVFEDILEEMNSHPNLNDLAKTFDFALEVLENSSK